jgi:hypothetical protein
MRWQRTLPPPSDSRGPAGTGIADAEADALEVSMEELAEFLEADLADVAADPEFKYSLRERLWELVQSRNRARRPGGGSR